MKKQFTLLSLLCSMTAAWAETGDGSDLIEVSDWLTLRETIRKDNAAKIKLTGDIIVMDLPEMICSDFRGEIHGQGYAISRAFTPLFESMTDATIENITFKDFIVYSEYYKTLGGVALTARGCNFHDITIDNFNVESHIDDNVDTADEAAEYNTGAFVGTLSSCTGDFENVVVKNSTIISYDKRAGGIAGYAYRTKFSRCEVDDQTGVFCDGQREANTYSKYSMVGGLVGRADFCTYADCVNSALVAGDWNAIGGFVGYSNDHYFSNCINTGIVMGLDDGDFLTFIEKYRKKQFHQCVLKYNGKTYILQSLNDDEAGKATSEDFVGGIVGWNQGSCQFNQCTNYGAIYSGSRTTGGIVGALMGSLINCLSAGPVSNGGSIVGQYFYMGSIKNCLALADDCKMCGSAEEYTDCQFNFSLKDHDRDVSDIELTVTSKEMKSGLVVRYLNEYNCIEGATPWRQNLTAHDGMEVDLYPTLDPSHDEVTFETMTSRIAIKDAKDLIAFAKLVNEGDKNQFACAHLEADIDMSEVDNWTPIGSTASYSQYRGCFDGRGHTIKNLTVSGSAAAGLFGAAHVGAEIRNLTIGEGSTITCSGDAGAGGILGLVDVNWNWGYVRIENCGSYANINVNKHGGGILGKVEMLGDNDVRVNVTNCFSMGTITAENGNSGLLCGYTKDHAHVSNCWSGGQLRNGKDKGIWPYSIENPKNPKEAECLVGYNRDLDIQNCYIVNPDDNVDKYKEDKGQYPLQAGVEIIYGNSLATGELTLMLNGNTNDASKSLTWQQNLGTDKAPVPGNKGVYHARSVSNEYGTVCLPYALKSDDNIRYYTFNESSDGNGETKLNFSYAETVAPGTPVLFKVAETGDIAFCDADNGWSDNIDQITSGDWMFVGLYQEREYKDESAQSVYYVSNGKIKNGKTVTIKPYRAYFMGPSIETLTGAQAKTISLALDGDGIGTTALELVGEDLVPEQQSGKSYSPMGTEVGEGYRGLVIRNGKKVIQNR